MTAVKGSRRPPGDGVRWPSLPAFSFRHYPPTVAQKLTAAFGIIFFITSIALGLLASHRVAKQAQLDFMPVPSVPANSVPASVEAQSSIPQDVMDNKNTSTT